MFIAETVSSLRNYYCFYFILLLLLVIFFVLFQVLNTEVKERVGLYPFPRLCALMACYRVNFTCFTVLFSFSFSFIFLLIYIVIIVIRYLLLAYTLIIWFNGIIIIWVIIATTTTTVFMNKKWKQDILCLRHFQGAWKRIFHKPLRYWYFYSASSTPTRLFINDC